MKIEQIRYVMEVAKCRSINKAAKNLFISQPTLTNSIRALEHMLGIIIFERTATGTTLTVEGIEFVQVAEKLLDQVEAIQYRYTVGERFPGNQFQISCQHYTFVTEAFIQFLNQTSLSHYRYKVKDGTTMAVLEDVHSHESLLGVICMTPTNKSFIRQILERWGIQFTPLILVRPHVFLRKEHPLAAFSEIVLDDLVNYPMIIYDQGKPGTEFLLEEVIFLDDHSRIVKTQDRGTMNNLIAHTNCFNIGTGYLVNGIVPDEITSRPVKGHGKSIELGYIQVKNRKCSRNEQIFIKFLKESVLKNYPGTLQKQSWFHG